MEEWREVKDFPGYQVSSWGRVKNRQGHIMKGRKNNERGLARLELWKGDKYTSTRICDIVARAFIGKKPEGHHVNFRNGDTHDNHADNLVYSTRLHFDHKGPPGRPVRVVETGHEYPHANALAKDWGAAKSSVAYALKDPKRTLYGLHLVYADE